MIFKGMGQRIAALRVESRWSKVELARRAGLTDSSHVVRIEREKVGIGSDALDRLARVFGVRSHWLATGEGPKTLEDTSEVLASDEREALEYYRGLHPDTQRCAFGVLQFSHATRIRGFKELHVRELTESVVDMWAIDLDGKRHESRMSVEETSVKAAETPVYDLGDLRARKETKTVRLVGDVAAYGGEAIAYEDRQGEEIEVPEELWCSGCQAVRVRGRSMEDDGLFDGDLLIVRPAKFGRRGADVLAWTREHGMVVKRFVEQRKGIIYLEPRGEGQPLSGPSGDEVQVRGIVHAVYRERGQD